MKYWKLVTPLFLVVMVLGCGDESPADFVTDNNAGNGVVSPYSALQLKPWKDACLAGVSSEDMEAAEALWAMIVLQASANLHTCITDIRLLGSAEFCYAQYEQYLSNRLWDCVILF